MYELQKCDGAKPTCGPCRKHPKEDDCEYSDGPTRSRTQILEETVSRLEARLYELEHPNETTPSVTLHDPYGRLHEADLQAYSPPLLSFSDSGSGMSPFSPISTTSTSSLPSDHAGGNVHMSGRHFTASPFGAGEDPPYIVVANLLDKFTPHAIVFGCFLNPARVRNAILLVPGYHTRPTPALMSVVCLWGTHLSRSSPTSVSPTHGTHLNPPLPPPPPQQHERLYLQRTLQHISSDLVGNHPFKVIQTIQTHVLLSYYFFRTGLFMEAKIHCATAVSLVLAAGMHKIRSINPTYVSSAPIAVQAESLMYMPPARDDEDEAERIAGFWAVFGLSKSLGIALESPVSVCGTFEAPGMCIDTPWPLDLDEGEQTVMPPEVQGNFTIRNFLAGTVPPSTISHSAMSIQAVVLLHRATHLSGTWSSTMQQREYQAYASFFQLTHHLIDSLRASLPPLTRTTPVATPTTLHPEYHDHWRTLLMAHAFVDSAVIKLHGHFAYAYNAAGGYSADSASRQYCLDAAMRIVAGCVLVSAGEVAFINPILGTLWVTASNILIDEIVRIRALKVSGAWLNTASPSMGSDTCEDELRAGLHNILKALRLFSDESAFMKYQVKKVEDSINTAVA
ncbi:hypothetical protein M378DRAFT_435252 [Amanita muscaria Koide BX008]|uniref:Transcription factor domain-containing protein n=1 Tax=Amanita muscaria (strain Koide BX008) TaxID=946122 RepID=A0A0C2S2K9_AMAMK|nr:hypothetical protein M378DRAFT_435252 [Amanita muscaria Koide BX008]